MDARRFVPTLDVAAVIADAPVRARAGVTVIVVENARKAMAKLAAAFHGHPARQIPIVGITGTNGKTTVSWMLESILTVANVACGVMGTTGHRIGGQAIEAKHTTPESTVIQALLARMLDENCKAGIMEVSSIGVAMERVAALPFQVAVFTSFSRDHLDFHGDMETYLQAKAALFEDLMDNEGISILNADEPACRQIHPHAKTQWTYGIDNTADFRADNVKVSVTGADFVVHSPEGATPIHLPMMGKHNVANALAAFAAARALGIPRDGIQKGLQNLPTIPGRVEPIPNKNGITILVDYAHTPDALEQVLLAMRALTSGKILTVFGCGGDRDPGKRPQMGRAASLGSDHVYITSDNPRSEDPDSIIGDIVPGVVGTYTIEVDRKSAIHRAIREAQPGDIVLIAGKGHETTQTTAGQTIRFDDRKVALEAVEVRA